MADILQMMVELLRINCNAVNCYYANPFEGLFYVVFLPAVILIAFLYILLANLRVPHKGIKILITVAVFVFIILQGWFTIFISLSYIWVIILIILAIYWTLRGRHRENGGGASKFPGGGKFGAAATKKFAQRTLGKLKPEIDPDITHKASGYCKGVESELDKVSGIKTKLPANPTGEQLRAFNEAVESLDKQIDRLDDYIDENPGLVPFGYGRRLENYRNRRRELATL